MLPSINISPPSSSRARSAARAYPGAGPHRVVLFDNYYILYFTGFASSHERPIAFVMNAAGEGDVRAAARAGARAGEDGIEQVIHYVNTRTTRTRWRSSRTCSAT